MGAKEPAFSSIHGSNQSVDNAANNGRDGTLCRSLDTSIVNDSSEFGNLPLPELDSIEELGISSGLGGNQDLSSWLNFDEDGLQDHDSIGLEIPMDDLSELSMIM
ncbi:uncharacterized protein G2W53_021380 [Senna tora]|uniref:Uncharacterized protein n=1 Tax=Senna tora TaxID=362788 RepID=A0A834WL22_9FABA|nr:uncharacterized protein G2W53_021380 [Senna tora]